jgi:hypothetical protein
MVAVTLKISSGYHSRKIEHENIIQIYLILVAQLLECLIAK